MIEIIAAAFIPPIAMLAIARFANDDFKRAAKWFAILALLWFAPCWLTGRSPAPFDYLAEDVPPWQQPGFVSHNALLSDATLQFLPWREVVRDSILTDLNCGFVPAPLRVWSMVAVLPPVPLKSLSPT